jgi:hypothetical protein
LGLVATAPAPSPTPTPTSTATVAVIAAPEGGYVISPTLNGAADLVAAFPVGEGLHASWGTGAIPGRYDATSGAFRFTCGGEGALAYDDPLLYPGKNGVSHLHKYFGANGVDASTTMASLAQTTSSNCNYGNKVLNRSAYWMPALLDDQGFVRNPDWIAVYYKRAMASAPACTPGSGRQQGICVMLPNQIRFIAGWDPTKPDEPGAGMGWYCTGSGAMHTRDLDILFQNGCKAGDELIADITFPDCWDGKYLDTPDHRSHMAGASYGDWGYLKCPASHPYVVPQTENKYKWTVTTDMYHTVNGVIRSRVRLASDHMKPGAKPGETLHGDYMEQWVGEVKRMWHEGCIEKGLNCSGGDLGNGLQISGAAQPSYGWVNPNPRSATAMADMLH